MQLTPTDELRVMYDEERENRLREVRCMIKQEEEIIRELQRKRDIRRKSMSCCATSKLLCGQVSFDRNASLKHQTFTQWR